MKKDKLKFRSIVDYDNEKQRGENCTGESETIPDMSYSIKELLTNFTKLPEIYRKAEWDENPDFDEAISIGDFDLTDLTESEIALKEKIQKTMDEAKSFKAKNERQKSASESSDSKQKIDSSVVDGD